MISSLDLKGSCLPERKMASGLSFSLKKAASLKCVDITKLWLKAKVALSK